MSFQKRRMSAPLLSAWLSTVAEVLPELEKIPLGLATDVGVLVPPPVFRVLKESVFLQEKINSSKARERAAVDLM